MNILGLGTSFMLGALDGVSPGHGKSLIAAFMIGEKLSWRQIAAMAGSLLFSHFLLLIVLSVGLQYAFGQQADLAWMEWVSPIVVILFGLYLLMRYRRLARLTKEQGHEAGCECGHHHHIASKHSSQNFLQSPTRHDTQNLVLAPISLHPHQPQQPIKDNFSWVSTSEIRNVRHASMFGFMLGMVPCPMAVSTILLSMTTDQFSTALMVILAYVLGMALVLLLIAGLLFMGRHLLAEKLDRLHYHVDVRLVSALMVIGIGVVYLLMNTFHLHAHAV